MPISDPTSGRLYVWITSCCLFTSIIIGGILLLMYVLLPQDPSRDWLPLAGVALVCLPWLFWFLTCFYRIISRAFGFRFVIGGNPAAGGGGRSCSNGFDNAGNETADQPGGNSESSLESIGGDGRVEQHHEDVHKISVASKESELPLKSAMVS